MRGAKTPQEKEKEKRKEKKALNRFSARKLTGTYWLRGKCLLDKERQEKNGQFEREHGG
jgi:hypothetical protein